MKSITSRPILTATLLAGTLDIVSAFLFAGMSGITPGQVLRFVASGPFGDGMRSGGFGAALAGLIVHFALMFVMVLVFAVAADRFRPIQRHWYGWGAGYGMAIYLIMYWLVIPMRFGTVPKTDGWSLGNALFSHIVCVGLPMAYVVARRSSRKSLLT